MSPTLQDLSNDTTFSKIKSRIPVPLICITDQNKGQKTGGEEWILALA